MFTVRGTDNQIPVKTKHLDEFLPLLKEKNIVFKFVGSIMGYFIYEFRDEKSVVKATKIRDKIYKAHGLTLEPGVKE